MIYHHKYKHTNRNI